MFGVVAIGVVAALAFGLAGSGSRRTHARATGTAALSSAGSRHARATRTTTLGAGSAGRAVERVSAAGGGRDGAGVGRAAGGAGANGASPGVPAVGAAGAAGTVAEVPDPEAARSFPAPASVHHKAASTPSRAADAIVAPGAPSDAEVRKELKQMHAVEHAARRQTLGVVPGGGSIGGNGALPVPSGVPAVVARVVAGANAIADFPYVFGGGHASFVDNAYDCSGSVSYALAAGGLLSSPLTSGSLESWGAPGPGQWITVYANAGHTYMYVNIGGRWMRYDTSGRSGVFASRWQAAQRSNAGFVARHPPGL